ncbi:guanylate kinase [bacterium]|nr:guanylate kinase [Candidatus Neomarinimicrobiota bacterium]MCK5684465.1 guanylate kinase [bacterium]
MHKNKKTNTNLIILAAHSGAGKSTIIRALQERHPDWLFSVSCTTRSPRNNEKNTVAYHFVSRVEFEELISNDELLEHEEVHGEYYGTKRSVADDTIKLNQRIIFDLDVFGALHVKKLYPQHSLSIFIDVPDLKILEDRLKKRGSDSAEKIAKRLSRIPMEREKIEYFDKVVINDKLHETINFIDELLTL